MPLGYVVHYGQKAMPLMSKVIMAQYSALIILSHTRMIQPVYGPSTLQVAIE